MAQSGKDLSGRQQDRHDQKDRSAPREPHSQVGQARERLRPDRTFPPAEEPLSFFPDRKISERQARALLRDGTPEERAFVVSHLLRYARWRDIWTYVTRDEVREIFDRLELSDGLRAAWARILKIEVPVG